MSFLNVLTYAAIPAVAVVMGGVLSSLRPPGAGMRSAVQHFAAGVVFAALATELLPEVMHRRLPLQTIAGFALGVVVMLLLKAFTGKRSEDVDTAKTGLPTTLLIAL
jgi:zinc transporter, ZIP family